MSLNRLTSPGARGRIDAATETVVANGAATGAVALDLSLANVFELTLTGNVTLSFTNPPPPGEMQTVTIIARQDATGGRTITFPASIRWPADAAPAVGTTAGHRAVFVLSSTDGGSTWLAGLSGSGYVA